MLEAELNLNLLSHFFKKATFGNQRGLFCNFRVDNLVLTNLKTLIRRHSAATDKSSRNDNLRRTRKNWLWFVCTQFDLMLQINGLLKRSLPKSSVIFQPHDGLVSASSRPSRERFVVYYVSKSRCDYFARS